jgi:hypothetical protein
LAALSSTPTPIQEEVHQKRWTLAAALDTIIKESKYDEIRQIFHGFNSTFTKTPIPHVIIVNAAHPARYCRKIMEI